MRLEKPRLDFARYNGAASPDRAHGVRAREDTKGEAMDPKRKKRPPAKVVKRIAEMKADRRRDLVKGALGLGAAVLLVVAKTALELCGLVSAENVAFVNLLLLMAMGLAIVTGTASIDFAKKGKAIRELCQEQGLSEGDAKELGIL